MSISDLKKEVQKINNVISNKKPEIKIYSFTFDVDITDYKIDKINFYNNSSYAVIEDTEDMVKKYLEIEEDDKIDNGDGYIELIVFSKNKKLSDKEKLTFEKKLVEIIDEVLDLDKRLENINLAKQKNKKIILDSLVLYKNHIRSKKIKSVFK